MRAAFTSGEIKRALPRGGVVTVVNGGTQSVIANLFPTGPARWSRTWSIVDGTGVSVLDAATTDAGRIAIAARFTGRALDLGGTPLAAPSAGTFEVVALLEPDGAVAWATLVDALDGDLQIAVSGDDQVILGGTFRGDGSALALPAADGDDGFLAVIDHTGVMRADLLGGPGDQQLGVLRAGSDGTAVFTITNRGALTIGAHAFPGGAHDFVIAMVP